MFQRISEMPWPGVLLAVFVLLAACTPLLSSQAATPGRSCIDMEVNDEGLWVFNPDLCAADPPPPPPKSIRWGAIAVSPSLAAGMASDSGSKEDAEAAALKKCKDADCKIAVSGANVCIALAVSPPEKISRIGGPIGAVNFADYNAELLCERAGGKSCTIAASLCSDGVRHTLQGSTRMPLGNPLPMPQAQAGPAPR